MQQKRYKMLIPIGKRIIIQPAEIKKGALIVTNNKPKRFVILAIGDEVTKVKPNDFIYLDRFSGAEIEHENEKYLVIEEIQILAKID